MSESLQANSTISHYRIVSKIGAGGMLNKLYESRAPFVMYVEGDTRLDSLRDDPRFQDLLKKIGFSR